MNQIFIGNEIGAFTSIDAILAEIAAHDAIELVINSNGGDTLSALRIVEALKGKRVEATIFRACSSAVTIAMAASVRRLASDGMILVHAPVNACMGTVGELQAAAAFLHSATREVEQLLKQGTGQPFETVQRWLSGSDWWFNAQESLAAGLATEVFEVPQSQQVEKVPPPIEPAKAPQEDPKIELLFSLLNSLGTIRVNDPKRFRNELSLWFIHNTRQNHGVVLA